MITLRSQFEKKYLFLALGLLLAVSFLCLHPMLQSSMLHHAAIVSMILLVCLGGLCMVLLAFRFGRDLFSLAAVTLASICMIANSTVLSLLQYGCEYPVETVADAAQRIAIDSLLAAFVFPLLAWGILSGAEAFYAAHPTGLLCTVCGTGFLLSAVVLVFGDADADTAVVKGVLIGLPVMLLTLLTLSLFLLEQRRLRWLCFAAIGCMLVSIFVRKETGIPILIYLTGWVYYMLFYPYRKKWRWMLILTMLPVLACLGLYLCIRFSITFPLGFLNALLEKANRLFDTMEQALAASESMADGGWFGNFRYTVYLPEGSSDMILATMMHFLGLAFLPCLGIGMVFYGVTGAKRYLTGTMSIGQLTAKLSMLLTLVVLVYNLLMVTGYVPILGMQPLFTGDSHMIFFTSGCMLGFATWDPERVAHGMQTFRNKRKELR